MKTAKAMFEELGWEYVCNNKLLHTYVCKNFIKSDCYSKHEKNGYYPSYDNVIKFYLNGKHIYILTQTIEVLTWKH